MDNKSNGKLIALAFGGAALMGALFFGVSFLTGFKVPAENISSVLTPLRSFTGWFLLILCASLIIRGFGKISGKVSDKWFLSLPLTIIAIVAVMFAILWLRPSGILLSTTGRTTTLQGDYIRTVDDLNAFLNQPAATTNVPPAPEGFDFAAAKDLADNRCNKCHTLGSVEDALRTKYKKTGKVDIIVKRMQSYPGSGISDSDAADIMIYLTEKF
ncbi:photosystem P840 reaction-center cytochrome c-551 [Pelodictyon luteolum]|uniref:Photosystem P840 reaction center cytochrome c-551 n=1 Tax=Chlorobium luteolum (strain DSM 273 / BCRC 81028 / 2530) TaxID=319225 RepID=Q3B2E9_CHLL3|nr:photosystem P840 reaction-center cytochrome c-551 [Pelodictyon luteolum]ABB24482.1 photosystem P840 reaction center cytochrome c-551 [Pelodictyon luteolum DSM 273]